VASRRRSDTPAADRSAARVQTWWMVAVRGGLGVALFGTYAVLDGIWAWIWASAWAAR